MWFRIETAFPTISPRGQAAGSNALSTFYLIRLDYLNNSTVPNGFADDGRKRLSVNFVFCPGSTSTTR
jgi:hypothetical protein